MNGFVISLQLDNTALIQYWAATDMTEDINEASFIEDAPAARRTTAALQNQFLDYTVICHPAYKGVQLKN